MNKEKTKPSFFSPGPASASLPSYSRGLDNVSLPYNVFIPDEFKDNRLLSRFIRRLIVRIDSYYRAKYLNLSDSLESINGPVYLPLLHSVLLDQGIEYNLFNMLTGFYVLGAAGKLPVRIKAIERHLNWGEHKMNWHLTRIRKLNYLTRHRSTSHPDGSSYQLTYNAVALLERVHKLFYAKVLTLPAL